jgi:hypothetical protein
MKNWGVSGEWGVPCVSSGPSSLSYMRPRIKISKRSMRFLRMPCSQVCSLCKCTEFWLTACLLPEFLLYLFFVTVVSFVLIFRIAPTHGNRNPLVYISICSLVGSVSVMSIKGFGIALKLTFAGNNQVCHFPSCLGRAERMLNLLCLSVDTFVDLFVCSCCSRLYSGSDELLQQGARPLFHQCVRVFL